MPKNTHKRGKKVFALLQAIPDPSSFGVLDHFGIAAVEGFVIAILATLLYFERKDKKAEEARADDYQTKYEDNLKESIRDYREKNRILELVTQRRDNEDR